MTSERPAAAALWMENSQQWSLVKPPLRPTREDLSFTTNAISRWLEAGNRAPAALVLGVTPELCDLPIDSGARLIAMDRSAEMLTRLWRPSTGLWREAVRGNWLQMPLPDGSIDLFLGDGSFSNFRYPGEYLTLFAELRRVTRAKCRGVVRCYMQPDRRESFEEVVEDLEGGRIGGFHIFKWRLLMASQQELREGAPVLEVWNFLQRRWPCLETLAERYGWPVEEVLSVRTYRHADIRHSFPNRREYEEIFAAGGFSIAEISVPSYELGERSPTIVLERSAAGPDGS